MFTFYGDELHNLILVADRGIKEIIGFTSVYDYHPPVQYILNKIFLELFCLNEFWLALPSIIFLLLSVIICSKLVYKITNLFSWSAASGIIMLLHPLVFLWGKSIRWYPFWTFLTILSIYLFISLWNSEKKRKRIVKPIVLIAIVATSLYTNYQTFMVIASVLLTVLLLDIKEKTWFRTKQTLIVLTGALLLFLPYISTFISHAEGFFIRKGIYEEFIGTSPLISGGYYLYSILFGQSSFPWNVSFIIFLIIGLIAFIAGIAFYFKGRKEIKNEISGTPNIGHSFLNIQLFNPVFYITGLLFVLSFVYSLFAGIYAPRGFIVLPMLIIAVLSAVVFYLHGSYKSKIIFGKVFHLTSLCTISILVLWLIGSYNINSKQHLHKNGLAIPIQEIISIIKSDKTATDSNQTIVTTDFVLTYYLMKDGNVTVLSPYSTELMKLFINKKQQEPGYMARIFFIESYPGSLMLLKAKLDNYKDGLFNSGEVISRPLNLAYDPDYEMKERFFPASGIEKWRYKIFVLSTKTGWDINFLKKISSFRVE